MGPVAIAKENLPKVLRVQTFVNGEKRQDSTTDDLIFSIPYLVTALSEAQTLRVGDILATGTPAGVGFGFKPPIWLKSGDEIRVSVTGLGSLTNKIGSPQSQNPILQQVLSKPYAPEANLDRSLGGVGLTLINSKQLFYQVRGSGAPVVCVHGLGGTSDYFEPLVSALPKSALHLCDLEGHGLSPTMGYKHVEHIFFRIRYCWRCTPGRRKGCHNHCPFHGLPGCVEVNNRPSRARQEPHSHGPTTIATIRS